MDLKELKVAFDRAKVIAFDMDGTLLDSVEARAGSFVKTLKEFGVEADMEEIKRYIGMRSIDIARDLVRRYSLPISPEEFAKRRIEIFYKEMISKVKTFPCVIELLEFLSNKYTLALTTSSSRRGVETLMGDLMKYFKIVITIEEVSRGKPHPDIYLKVKEIDENAIAVEDSCVGIRSAKSAGLIVIGVLNGNKEGEELRSAGADYIFKDICELYNWVVREL